MSTGIEWTDETWNPVVGCERVSPGCARCYAKELHDMRHRAHLAGKAMARQYAHPFETVQLKPERLAHPLSWRTPRRVFVNSVADLFHDDVPDEFIARVFAVMSLAQRHTFQVLTKRPERMAAALQYGFRYAVTDAAIALHADPSVGRGADCRWMERGTLAPWPLPNVWLGVSVENQRWADERIPLLLDPPAAVRFLSCEPLLGPVDLTAVTRRTRNGGWAVGDVMDTLRGTAREANGSEILCAPELDRIDWVISGGESGKGARPMSMEWAAALRDQCTAAGVPFFLKQLGGEGRARRGGAAAVLDGQTWTQMPQPCGEAQRS